MLNSFISAEASGKSIHGRLNGNRISNIQYDSSNIHVKVYSQEDEDFQSSEFTWEEWQNVIDNNEAQIKITELNDTQLDVIIEVHSDYYLMFSRELGKQPDSIEFIRDLTSAYKKVDNNVNIHIKDRGIEIELKLTLLPENLFNSVDVTTLKELLDKPVEITTCIAYIHTNSLELVKSNKQYIEWHKESVLHLLVGDLERGADYSDVWCIIESK